MLDCFGFTFVYFALFCVRTPLVNRYRPAAVAGPHLLGAGDFNKGQPLTNFEAKYIASGQPTYELLLGFSEGEMGDEAKSDEGAGYFFP